MGRESSRSKRLQAFVQANGLVRTKLTSKSAKATKARFSDLPDIPSGATMKHHMRGMFLGCGLEIAEFHQIVMAGNVPVPMIISVYALETPRWPKLRITPRGAIARFWRRVFGGQSLELEDERFNLDRKVVTQDPEFATLLLVPDMQAFMLSHPRVRWHLEAGRANLIYQGQLKPRRMPDSLERLALFWELVPEVLRTSDYPVETSA